LQKFSKDVEKLLGPKGSKLFEKRKDRSFLRQVDELAVSMRGFQKEPGNLMEYSPWLSGFKADRFSNELEIPGLSPQSHVMICVVSVDVLNLKDFVSKEALTHLFSVVMTCYRLFYSVLWPLLKRTWMF